jgi:hypothetical protein
MCHVYEIRAFATKGGKAVACDVFHDFYGKRVHVATTRRYVTYPASVRARNEGRAIAERHAKSLNILPENVRYNQR